MIPVIYLLAFSGGFVIMSLELLGGRILAPYFGSGIYVWGSIITIFMLSLSIGYLLGGRLSVHNPSSSRFAAIFAIAAVLLLPLTIYAQGIMEFIFLRVEDPRYGSLVTSIVLFGLPTVILGMISPTLCPAGGQRRRIGPRGRFPVFRFNLGKCYWHANDFVLLRAVVRSEHHHYPVNWVSGTARCIGFHCGQSFRQVAYAHCN